MTNFAYGAAAVLKEADPNHLISLCALVASCGTYGEVQLQPSYASPFIDLIDYHIYGYTAPPFNTNATAGYSATLALAAQLNKPIFVGEFGLDWTEYAPDQTPPQPVISPETTTERASLLVTIMQTLSADGVVGFLPWAYGTDTSYGESSEYGYEFNPGDPFLQYLGSF
jgi:hypothetical protein